MGVLACDRTGCTHIMCDTLIRNNYLCWSCLAEFKAEVGDQERSEREFVELLKRFLES